MTATNRKILGLIFITVVVDMLGFGISFPILPILFSPESPQFGLRFSPARLGLLYGLLQSSFAVAQFIGAPILGSLSDRYGRKRILLVSLTGACIGYLFFAYGIYKGNLGLMFIGRVIPGFAGGNISIVYSALADISSGNEKVKNFGLVGMAFGLGMIIGPVIGGLLSDDQILPFFDLSTPFMLAALLSGSNIVLVWRFLPETIKTRNFRRISLLTGFYNLKKAFSHPKLHLIFTVVLIHASGFAFFTQFIQFFFIEQFGFDQSDIGLIFGYVGIWAVLTQGLIIRPVAAFLRPEALVRLAIPGLLLTFLAMLIPASSFWLYIILPFMTVFQGLYLPNMTAIVSNLSDENIQGEMLGINQSLLSVSNAVPPIIGGLVLAAGVRIPIFVAAGCSLCGWLIYLVFYQRQKRVST